MRATAAPSNTETCLEMGFTALTFGYNGPDWNVDTCRDRLACRDDKNASLQTSMTRHMVAVPAVQSS